uniref:Uncharacterized protein n=1 Tax=Micrurus spixii TaxID=129469 RepID=A0A2D4LAX9_9SAUR
MPTVHIFRRLLSFGSCPEFVLALGLQDEVRACKSLSVLSQRGRGESLETGNTCFQINMTCDQNVQFPLSTTAFSTFPPAKSIGLQLLPSLSGRTNGFVVGVIP